MGYIYKITNKTNKQIYVGQTRISITSRWKAHCSVAFCPNNKDYNFALHRAIRKYGKDNFLVEKIESVPDEQLDEREIYWIQHYDSYNNGYNCALGGLGHQKYNYDDIVNYYLTDGQQSVVKTCKDLKLLDQVVYSALQSKQIDYKNLKSLADRAVYKNKIRLVEKDLIFNSMVEIDKYFGKQVHGNIRRCLDGRTKKAYGFHWEVVEDEQNLYNE